MTATDLPVQGRLQTSKDRQARITGGILIGLAIVIALSFAPGPDIVSKFRLSRPGDRFMLGDLVVPATAFIYAAASAVAFLGARQFLRVGARWTSISLGIGLTFAVMTFLVWATAGKALSLTGMLQATMVRAVPIALGGLAGVLFERVAVVNITIEGMLLAGAFNGALIGSLFGGVSGLVAAVAIGGFFWLCFGCTGGYLPYHNDRRRVQVRRDTLY